MDKAQLFPSGESLSKTPYIPALDGLRGISILLVFLCHAGWWTYGFVGVWLFFALSGFLITRILLSSRESPHYYKSFYIRRGLRILPLYLMAVFVAFTVYAFMLAYPDAKWLTLGAYLLFLQNITISFFPHLVQPAIGHTWSLAVEEQFYWLYPIGVRWFKSAARLEKIAWWSLLAAPFLRMMVNASASDNGTAVFMLPWWDLFAYGAWLASRAYQGIPAIDSAKRLNWLLGIVLVVYGLVQPFVFHVPYFWQITYDPLHPGSIATQPIFYLMPPLCGWALAQILAHEWLQKILCWRPLRFTGEISYGLYILHGLLIPAHFINVLPHAARPFAWIGISYALAWLSWRCLEMPVLRLKRFFPYRDGKLQ